MTLMYVILLCNLGHAKFKSLTSSFVTVGGRWPATACSALNERIAGNSPF